MLYSRLVPPTGLWLPTVYLQPELTGPVTLHPTGLLDCSLTLSLYWRDFRLVIRSAPHHTGQTR